MHTIMRNQRRFAIVFLMVIAILVSGLNRGNASAAPALQTASFDLCATTGTVAMPGVPSVPIWGYALGDCSGTATPSLPGPTITVTEGDDVTVTLHNNLPEETALLFPGQAMIPDLAAVANGGSKSYTFTASQPGTYLYEAGLLSNAQHQVAMGLYGALVVQSATTGTAYGTAASAFDTEATLVLSELDPTIGANPAGFDMRNYHPRYYLINGKAYPNTDPIAAAVGNRVLLRFVNAGLQSHSMTVLGFSQSIVALDGSPLAYPSRLVAETIAPGQTQDSIVALPATAVDGSKFPIYDANLTLRNSGAVGMGGMLALLEVGTPTLPGADTVGPTTSGVTLAPNAVSGSTAVTVSAMVSDVASGGSNIFAAEYRIDSTTGTAYAMSGAFASPTESVSAAIPAAIVGALSTGNHTIYVRGQDSAPAGNWGAFSSAVLRVDNTGPSTTGLVLTPAASNGAASVSITGTANDSANGNSNIAAAEYFIDTAGADGSGTAMNVNSTTAPIAGISGSIPAGTIMGLSAGTHTVAVHSQDSMGNWGAFANVTLTVDMAGPSTSSVVATPNPTNGQIGFNSSTPALRVTASFSDPLTNISAGEGFIDTVGANGTGFIFIATDGLFNNSTESGYVNIPLSTIVALSQGNHTLSVHGKDAAGNWGDFRTVDLLVDKTAPTFSGITVVPSPTNGASSVTLTVNGASDTGGAGVSGGEYWICPTTCTNPAPGGGTQFSGTSASIPVSSLATGSYTVNARIRDAAGNWSSGMNGIRTASLTVWADAIFSNGFETGTRPWGWSSASTNSSGRLDVTTNPALVGTRSLQAAGNNTNYVQFNFGTAAIPAAPTYDARFYFRPNGNNSTGKDIFSAATSSTFGTTTLFRVRYRLSGTTPQVQIVLGTGTSATWTNISAGTSNNVIEVVWQAVGSGGPNPGTLQLYVNGVLAQTLTTTSTGSVGAIRLGSVTSTGNSTAMYFDAFASKRQTTPLLGP